MTDHGLRKVFEKWATAKGMSIAKNQSEGARYLYYHNRNTKQAWKLWKEIVAAIMASGEPQP